ncbi:MAG TPA: hypothetical protein VJQ84_06270 [Solirubrobacterales bacterium]|nr:hypothetical protein [Solirubrobacterales bacterium]
MSIYQRDPAAPGANIRRRAAEPIDARLEAAVISFNASEAGRTVAGLARSLGRPRASVGAAAGSLSQARITVAWELCWYQWGVDFSSGEVFELGRGSELETLDRAARHWNAEIGEGAQIVFGAAGRPRRRGWLRRR